jgi:6,7-dimethyl-8-ribityllumazine synthase
MAGFLPKPREEFHQIPNAKLAIIAAMWHKECVTSMVERAREELLRLGVKNENIQVHYLPGSLELPYAARKLFEKNEDLDAVLAFGVVLKGATTHDDSVIDNVVQGFSLVSDRFNKPIVNEVIGVTSVEDAEKRSDDTDSNKGVEAVFAISELLHWQETL